jgi:NADH dehydrogenase [ubiquinone] 1 alpha subcomplex assembly factor 5
LDDIVREGGFPLALDVGSGVGHVYRAINAQESFEGVGGVGGVRKLVQLDSSAGMLHRDDDLDDTSHNDSGPPFCGTYKMVTDEEGKLPFPDGTFDLVISSTALHWVNDLPTFLSETKVRYTHRFRPFELR